LICSDCLPIFSHVFSPDPNKSCCCCCCCNKRIDA
jgi:hypothetical protein